MTAAPRPAIFLDRDGTLIEDRGHLSRPGEVVFFEQTFPALRQLQATFRLFIVTNQSGIGEGLITAADAATVNNYVVGQLADNGVQITEVYVCPHSREEGCSCIKPHPHMLLQATREHGVDLPGSYTIGDHPHDVELAARAGARGGILLLTGHGLKHRHELPKCTPTAAHIGEAVAMIAAHR